MKKLFIYYSNTGNGDAVAERLSEKGYEIRKVTPKNNLPQTLFLKVFFGGFIAGINFRSKLLEYDGNVGDYDEIVIGSPVWNGKISCPINTVLAKTDLTGKKVSFILYSGSGEAPKAEKRLHKEYAGASIIILKEPKKNSEILSGI
ncbi:MAG: hypothetical protein J5903_04605 [Clostridia bacterium]|nr:hypothetical protein [Clostridia bacterium]